MKLTKEYLKSEKMRKAVIALIGILGILLILVSFWVSEDNGEKEAESSLGGELEIYGQYLENKLEETLSCVTGKDSLEIMITFSDTFVSVYNTPESNNNGFVDNYPYDNFNQPQSQNRYAEVKQMHPRIAGAVIVCKKKLNREGYIAIKKAAATALNISESKIYLIGGEESYEKNS